MAAHEDMVHLRSFGGELRQITVRRGSLRLPSSLLTNDFEASLSSLLRQYGRRWLIERSISEQLSFFHFNHLSSTMVSKVDFDLAVTIFAHSLRTPVSQFRVTSFRRIGNSCVRRRYCGMCFRLASVLSDYPYLPHRDTGRIART